MIDADSRQCSILKQTSFGQKSTFLDMDTSPYQVYLESQFVPYPPRGPQVATAKIQGGKSMA
jgi:hypothetical protein